MNATIASVTQVSKKYRVTVHVPVNHRAQYHQDVISANSFPSSEIDAQFAAYTADYENGVKDLWPDWAVKDTTRNGSFTLEPKAAAGEFICHVQFDIVSATAITEVTVESDLEGTELTALLQAHADAAADSWIQARNLVPLA